MTRTKMPFTADEFFRLCGVAKKQGRGAGSGRRHLLVEIHDELVIYEHTPKYQLDTYLASLRQIAALAAAYVRSRPFYKKQNSKANACRLLAASAARRAEEVEGSVGRYHDEVRGRADPRPLTANPHGRLSPGAGLHEDRLLERPQRELGLGRSLPMTEGSVVRMHMRKLGAELNDEDPGRAPWILRQILKNHRPALLERLQGEHVLNYFQAQGRLEYARLDFQNGQASRQGIPVHTLSQTGTTWIYAVDNVTGAFYSTRGEREVIHHSSFFDGLPVMCAGDLCVNRGRPVWISNGSGHYTPDARNLHDALLYLRDEWSLDLGGLDVFLLVDEMGQAQYWRAVEFLAHVGAGREPDHPVLTSSEWLRLGDDAASNGSFASRGIADPSATLAQGGPSTLQPPPAPAPAARKRWVRVGHGRFEKH